MDLGEHSGGAGRVSGAHREARVQGADVSRTQALLKSLAAEPVEGASRRARGSQGRPGGAWRVAGSGWRAEGANRRVSRRHFQTKCPQRGLLPLCGLW